MNVSRCWLLRARSSFEISFFFFHCPVVENREGRGPGTFPTHNGARLVQVQTDIIPRHPSRRFFDRVNFLPPALKKFSSPIFSGAESKINPPHTFSDGADVFFFFFRKTVTLVNGFPNSPAQPSAPGVLCAGPMLLMIPGKKGVKKNPRAKNLYASRSPFKMIKLYWSKRETTLSSRALPDPIPCLCRSASNGSRIWSQTAGRRGRNLPRKLDPHP